MVQTEGRAGEDDVRRVRQGNASRLLVIAVGKKKGKRDALPTLLRDVLRGSVRPAQNLPTISAAKFAGTGLHALGGFC